MRLDNYEEFIEYALDKFENEEDITVVCNYELAHILNGCFSNEKNIKYNSIQFDTEISEYYVSKLYNKELYIEPIKFEEKIQTVTNSYFIVDNDILQENPMLFNHLEGCMNKDFRIEVIKYKCTDEDCIVINEINDENEEELVYLQLADLIEEYVGLILDNECKEEVLGHALTEFAGKILQNFCLEKE
ncbi:hypothetical protein QB607_003254 [Clostridium botulinum]|nr:hypothetical protein [Clostridium botulinum]EKS4395926.1 hypothetical protein [Clostridium botulinum]